MSDFILLSLSVVRLFEVDGSVGDDCVSGDSAGDKTVSDGASAETAGTVCSAGYFTCCVKPGNRFFCVLTFKTSAFFVIPTPPMQ